MHTLYSTALYIDGSEGHPFRNRPPIHDIFRLCRTLQLTSTNFKYNTLCKAMKIESPECILNHHRWGMSAEDGIYWHLESVDDLDVETPRSIDISCRALRDTID